MTFKNFKCNLASHLPEPIIFCSDPDLNLKKIRILAKQTHRGYHFRI